jgi:hypothetical protein
MSGAQQLPRAPLLRHDGRSRGVWTPALTGRGSMKGIMLCTAMLLTCTLTAHAADKREQTFVIGADVNTQGEVTQTQPEASVTAPIAAMLDLALKQWRFEPVQQDGKAVSVHTFIEARLEATPDDNGKYTLRISYMRHGPTWDRDQPPKYPEDAIRLRETGIVAMTGNLQPDGKIVITDTRSIVESGRGRSSLKTAAIDWFSRHVVTPETVDGHPAAARIRAYVAFRLNEIVGGQVKPAPEVPYNAREKELLLQAGFKDSGNGEKIVSPEISSVLQTRMVNPVTMRL